MTWWNKYVGTKFKDKGRSPDGVDCWGLVCLIYKNEFGIDLPHYTECYESTNDKEILSELIANESDSKWVAVKNPKEGDVLVLKIDGMPFHVGIFIHDGAFIHCERGANTSIAKLNGFRWRGKIKGIYRWSN